MVKAYSLVLFYDTMYISCLVSAVSLVVGYLLGLIYSGSGTIIKGVRVWDFTRANVVKGIYLKEFLEELY